MRKAISKIAAGTACIAALTTALSSCTPDSCTACMEEGMPSTLELNIVSGGVKSTSVETQEQDNLINTLDVFIFRMGDSQTPGYGTLDTYARLTGETLLNPVISTTTGPKLICVLANSGIQSYDGIADISAFRTLTTALKDEALRDFCMYGEIEEELGVTAEVSLTVSRFVARIGIESIKTDFAGSPFEGMSLTNCRIYLVNAHGDKLIYNGGPTAVPVIMNQGGAVEEDVNSTSAQALLFDEISGEINDAGYTAQHFFYCYSNETEDIESCTKLVFQADLDGVTYYYPIPVNQSGYRLPSEESTHSGIRRNTAYSYGITITKPGSIDPETPIEPGTLDLTVKIAGWDVVPAYDKVF